MLPAGKKHLHFILHPVIALGGLLVKGNVLER